MNARVVILLPTLNGMSYLREQVDSLIAQSYEGWDLIVRDDGSTDGTQSYLEQLAKVDSRIHIHTSSGLASGSTTANVSILIEAALDMQAKYIFLCDQDDIWLPMKVKRQLDLLQSIDDALPALAISDLIVVDERASGAGQSSWFRLHGVPDSRCWSSAELASRNLFPGCSMAFNAELAKLSLPVPQSAIMHDWWLALLAASGGAVIVASEPLLKYRQHAENQIGASNYRDQVSDTLNNWFGKGSRDFANTFAQGYLALRRLFSRGFVGPSVDLVHAYVKLVEEPLWRRLFCFYKLGIRRYSVGLWIVFAVRLLFQCPKSQSLESEPQGE